MLRRVASARDLAKVMPILKGERATMAELQKRRPAPASQSRLQAQTGPALGPQEREFVSPRTAAPDTTSTTAKLLAQVEALQAELAAARATVAELEIRADIDPLSNVFNRRGFDRELRRTLAYTARYNTTAALIYLDLDAFKPINDTYGHAGGDAALKAAAAALAAMVRASDIVGRLGGDEFAILLWNLNERSAAAKALALEETIANAHVSWEGATIRLAASAGWTMLAEGDEPATVLARADAAMYARKQARRAP